MTSTSNEAIHGVGASPLSCMQAESEAGVADLMSVVAGVRAVCGAASPALIGGKYRYVGHIERLDTLVDAGLASARYQTIWVAMPGPATPRECNGESFVHTESRLGADRRPRQAGRIGAAQCVIS